MSAPAGQERPGPPRNRPPTGTAKSAARAFNQFTGPRGVFWTGNHHHFSKGGPQMKPAWIWRFAGLLVGTGAVGVPGRSGHRRTADDRRGIERHPRGLLQNRLPGRQSVPHQQEQSQPLMSRLAEGLRGGARIQRERGLEMQLGRPQYVRQDGQRGLLPKHPRGPARTVVHVLSVGRV